MTAPVVTTDVADCVRSHVSWMTALTTLPGGTAWTDGPLHWVFDGPYATVHGLFPDELDTAAAGRALRTSGCDGSTARAGDGAPSDPATASPKRLAVTRRTAVRRLPARFTTGLIR